METRRCVEAAPCDGDDGCLGDRLCIAGACTDPCAEDADCPGADVCDAGRCVPPSGCEIDLDCGAGRLCDDGMCRDGCPAAPCADGEVCREDGRCVAPGACMENADCDGAQRCEDARCVEPIPCNGDVDCLGDRLCRDAVCVRPCDGDDACVGQQVCDAGVCREGPGCEADAECNGDRICHPEVGACVDPCPDGLCPPGLECGEDGLCGEPAVCLDDSQCLPGRGCRLGRCLAVGCDASADCEAVCLDFECVDAVPGTCECPDGWACEAGGCVQPGPCDAGTCPAPWRCDGDGFCVACLNDAHCAGDAVCDGGRCRDGACAEDADCLPGRVCAGGACDADFACEDDGLVNAGPDRAFQLVPMALSGLVACGSVPDWFRVDGGAGVRITVRSNPARPPMRVRLFAAADSLTPVAVSATMPGEARVEAGSGEWLVEVSAVPGGAGPYSIEVEGGVDCADDAYERPWRNDAPDNARVIAPGVVTGTLCDGDADWFSLPDPRRYSARIEGADARIGNREAPGEVDGPTTVRVTGDAGSRYTLTVEAGADPAGRCMAAPALRADVPTDATVEAGPDDFRPMCRGASMGPDRAFRIDLAEGGAFTARLEAQDPRATLLLYEGCDAEPVQCGDIAGQLDLQLEAGRYYLVVDGPYAGDVSWSLAAPAAYCADPPPLQAGAPARIVLPAGASGFEGECVDGEGAGVVRSFELMERSAVALAVEGGGADALVSIRSECDGGAALACELLDSPTARATLDAGSYVAFIQGAPGDAVQAELTVEPAAAGPMFADDCDDSEAPLLAAGADLRISGNSAGAADDVDLAACAGAALAGDAVARFRLEAPARVTAFVNQAAFAANVALVDGDCGEVVECGSAMTGDVVAELQAGTYALVFEGRGPADAGPFEVRLIVE